MAQLWHMGRVVHSRFLGGDAPVSASATVAPGTAHTYDGKLPYDVARPLRPDEIPALLADYRQAARNAMAAGFDGVQLHAANGYLIDQFLRDGNNQRQDVYGGSVVNRIRLLIEVTQALIEVVGADRTSVRLSPNDDLQGCSDSDPEALFLAASGELDALGIAFLELRASRSGGTFVVQQRELVPAIRRVYSGNLVLNQDYSLPDAASALRAGTADAISFGRAFIANPDLPARLAQGAALNEAVESTFYSRGEQGYTDYPLLAPASGRILATAAPAAPTL